jgi:hypothetical protein
VEDWLVVPFFAAVSVDQTAYLAVAEWTAFQALARRGSYHRLWATALFRYELGSCTWTSSTSKIDEFTVVYDVKTRSRTVTRPGISNLRRTASVAGILGSQRPEVVNTTDKW